ncbi:unnamed protein product [Amoebophrya sp. A120]|nr:unnamed protein product [Amoebophrya sp. A120]|eukprot:GSA120T00019810001.1
MRVVRISATHFVRTTQVPLIALLRSSASSMSLSLLSSFNRRCKHVSCFFLVCICTNLFLEFFLYDLQFLFKNTSGSALPPQCAVPDDVLSAGDASKSCHSDFIFTRSNAKSGVELRQAAATTPLQLLPLATKPARPRLSARPLVFVAAHQFRRRAHTGWRLRVDQGYLSNDDHLVHEAAHKTATPTARDRDPAAQPHRQAAGPSRSCQNFSGRRSELQMNHSSRDITPTSRETNLTNSARDYASNLHDGESETTSNLLRHLHLAATSSPPAPMCLLPCVGKFSLNLFPDEPRNVMEVGAAVGGGGYAGDDQKPRSWVNSNDILLAPAPCYCVGTTKISRFPVSPAHLDQESIVETKSMDMLESNSLLLRSFAQKADALRLASLSPSACSTRSSDHSSSSCFQAQAGNNHAAWCLSCAVTTTTSGPKDDSAPQSSPASSTPARPDEANAFFVGRGPFLGNLN